MLSQNIQPTVGNGVPYVYDALEQGIQAFYTIRLLNLNLNDEFIWGKLFYGLEYTMGLIVWVW